MDYGCRAKITHTSENGDIFSRSLLVGPPRCLFKSESQAICVTFKFTCFHEKCSCQLTYKNKQEMKRLGQKIVPCPFMRQIKIMDSFLFMGTSLNNIVQQVHQAGKKENLSVEEIFPSTIAFLRSENLTENQILLVIQKKFDMPHEAVRCYDDLLQEECPTKNQFKSSLRGTEGLTNEEMANFQLIWKELKVPDLAFLYSLYVKLDTTELGDAIFFFFSTLLGLELFNFVPILSSCSSVSLPSLTQMIR